MGAHDSDRASTPNTARDGTRLDDEDAPYAVRIPPRDTDPVDGPPDESGVSERGGARAPRSDVPTPRNAEPPVSERSAPTVRRADRISKKAPAPSAPANEANEDTLLSAPAPADGFEVDVDRRLEETERRLDQLEADFARLAEARRKPVERPLGQNPLFWMVFLLAVVVSWLAMRGVR